MFKIIWDKETNGIILTNEVPYDKAILPPRPVFFEELDLFGFSKYWTYPNAKNPLLWSIGRRYYYKGVFVAEIKGGNIYERPELVINEKGMNLNLKPIEIQNVLLKNKKAMFTLENEALDFVEYSYKKNSNKVDFFSVAFSGGKDSQVVLDLISRVLSPDNYLTIFSDTTIENPYTYELLEYTLKRYKKTSPSFKLHRAKPNKSAFEYWKLIKAPSRLNRWCCSILKSSPFVKLVKEIDHNNKLPKILVFEGVRANESIRRSKYDREAKSVKHIRITNCRPIFNWNDSEVFLYLFRRKIQLNKSYRYGLLRIGCSVCPFNTEYSEYIINKIFPGYFDDFYKHIKQIAKNHGVNNDLEIKEYISKGNWKKIAGGDKVNHEELRIDFIEDDFNLKAIIKNPRENFFEWIKVMGDINYSTSNGITEGKIKTSKDIIDFKFENNKNKVVILFKNVCKNILLKSELKKILYKTTYCVNCGTCEAECKSNAMSILPKIRINKEICSNCKNCLNFIDRGCLVAKSLRKSEGSYKMKKRNKIKSGIDRYSTFGIREKWLDDYLSKQNTWFEKNNLGNKQVDAMISWLRESGLMSIEKKTISDLVNILIDLKQIGENIIWEIVWINLCYNSTIVNWYANKINFSVYTKADLLELLKESFPDFSENTLKNPLSALLNMFDNTPIGDKYKLGILEKKGRVVQKIRKYGTNKVSYISIAYSLFKYAEYYKKYDLTVSELYEKSRVCGPYKIFGINKESLSNILRSIQENKKYILSADLTAGLDNINLNKSLDLMKVLKMFDF